MKMALFNIQNIFQRHIRLVERCNAKNKDQWVEEFETLLIQPGRTQRDYDRMRILSHFLGFDKEEQIPYFTIKNTIGQLTLRKGLDREMPKSSHLTDWEGWAKIDSMPIDELAIMNKAKVIAEVDPDILVLLEVEDRISLVEFNRHFLSPKNGSLYKEIVFLGTNDPYGRGIGVLAKEGFDLESIKTHVNDSDEKNNPLFDVDLQEYRFRTSSGLNLDVHCTHFTNNDDDSEVFCNRQKMQSEYISKRFSGRQKDISSHSVFLGTLNAPCYSSAIAPIINDTYLKDITKHPNFLGDLDRGKDADYFRLGAYKMGVNIKQRDYLMLSGGLFNTVENWGLIRKGMWHKQQPQWNIFGSINNEKHAASEHPLLWCQLNI
ncbi:hypothetical protein [Flagellimonas sp. CMM7]|uniref:hypothetical protein n=1 Tax=Flagellimonas sp. CMM7 TaxID=2654676 RepID=UPI0013D71BF2|nr:hypothetical protein [Flagellimonas sp. CMM7]UII81104.1 hypothetical protein LV704_06210 [Flagellimonas sp. CMM7]